MYISSHGGVASGMEMDEEDSDFDDSPVVPKLRTYKEAINALEDVCQFLEYKGHWSETLSIGSSINCIVHLLTQDKPHFMNTHVFHSVTSVNLRLNYNPPMLYYFCFMHKYMYVH